MRRAFLLVSILPAALLARSTQAQSEGDAAAYLALTLTPIGAFAPVARASWLDGSASGAFALRYGRLSYDDDDAIHNIGVGGDFGAGPGRLGITAGAVTCSGCDAILILGADWTTSLVRRASTEQPIGVGMTIAGGAGIPTAEGADGMALSASVGLPMTMVAGNPTGFRVIPYVTPAIGFGTLTGEGGASGVRPMLAGGIGLLAANGVGLSAGLQKVFMEGGEAVLGLALTIGGRHSRAP
jgi:hypothetical protein